MAGETAAQRAIVAVALWILIVSCHVVTQDPPAAHEFSPVNQTVSRPASKTLLSPHFIQQQKQ